MILLIACVAGASSRLHELVAGDRRAEAVQEMANLAVSGELEEALAHLDPTDGFAPLHTATRRGYLEMVQLLVENGAAVDAKAADTRRPLHLAASMDFLDVAKLLISSGADVSAVESTGGWSPLHFAAIKGNREVIKLLIAKGASLEATADGTPFDETPEALAVRTGWPDEADLLAAAAGRPARHGAAADAAIAAAKAEEAAKKAETLIKAEL
jgi:ankyrin